jgi:hypothetical protein
MNETLLLIFIGVSTLAIVIQMCVLIAMAIAAKKTSAQVEQLATEIRTKALPAVETVQTLIVDNKGKVEDIIDNLATASATARGQIVRIDATLNDVLDRARLQIIRADELTTSTMDKVEETTEILQHAVISPVRRLSGVMTGLSAGLGMFVAGRKARKNGGHRAAGAQSEDMFI